MILGFAWLGKVIFDRQAVVKLSQNEGVGMRKKIEFPQVLLYNLSTQLGKLQVATFGSRWWRHCRSYTCWEGGKEIHLPCMYDAEQSAAPDITALFLSLKGVRILKTGPQIH